MDKLQNYYNLKRPILITGESGTGKTYLAKNIFKKSSIHKEKFVHVHLTSLQDELFASELFGHKKGSFTGANGSSKGYVEEVGTGTLFLDEIGDLSLKAQKTLLFFLEEQTYYKVGCCETKVFRGRILMATRRNLHSLVKEQKFREDLYFRLMLFNIEVNPLRTRIENLERQIDYYLNYFKNIYKKPNLEISNELKKWMLSYSWPGNTRELKNLMEFCVFMAKENVGKEHMPKWIRQSTSSQNSLSNYHESLESYEKDYLLKALYKFQGGINKTCAGIGISKSTLIAKIKKYGINVWDIKAKVRDNVI